MPSAAFSRRMRAASSEAMIPSISGNLSRASTTAGRGPMPEKSIDFARDVSRRLGASMPSEDALLPTKAMAWVRSPPAALSAYSSAMASAMSVFPPAMAASMNSSSTSSPSVLPEAASNIPVARSWSFSRAYPNAFPSDSFGIPDP
jgi:hypothetical protein